MSVNMLVQDSRLTGSAPENLAPNVYFVDGTSVPGTRLGDAFLWMYNFAQTNGKIKNLYFFCHGEPGYLFFCQEGIGLHNVGMFWHLRGLVEGRIIMAGCEVAAGSGTVFCQKIADFAQAPVVASDTRQDYYKGGSYRHCEHWHGIEYNCESRVRPLERKPWLGNVFLFTPGKVSYDAIVDKDNILVP